MVFPGDILSGRLLRWACKVPKRQNVLKVPGSPKKALVHDARVHHVPVEEYGWQGQSRLFEGFEELFALLAAGWQSGRMR